MSEDYESPYGDSNRAFLQAFLAHNTLTLKEGQKLLAAIFSVDEGKEVTANDVTAEDLSSYVNAANAAISHFDLEIRSSFHQQSHERVWALVNTTSDPLTQLATTYGADEIAFVKRLLDAMFETYNTARQEVLAVTSMQAVGLAKGDGRRTSTQNTQGGSATHGIPMQQAERVLGSLVDEGWLEKSKKGFYSLSPRALMELRGWLVATYNDEEEDGREDGRVDKVKMCDACKEIVTVGQRCPTRECPTRLHDHCTQQYFRMKKSDGKCPVCKVEWTGKEYVGERAITTSEKYRQGQRRSGGNAGSSRRTNGVVDDEGGGGAGNENMEVE